MGVFRVLDTRSGTAWIGSSVDLPSMLNRQRFQLEMGGHPDKGLQRAWDASSPESFVFEVLDVLAPGESPDYDPKDDLRELEIMWREKLAGTERGANE
jgi:hypothetical protein